MLKRLLTCTLAGCLLAATCHAKVVTETINYKVADHLFTGYLAYDDAKPKHPGVLVVHEWWGHNEYARKRARMLAEAGYTAFALDMYGTGKVADHPSDAQAFMQEVFANEEAAEKRFHAAYNLLQKNPHTQSDKMAAIGYCFGGAIVLHMARVGMPLDAVVSFHGSLAANLPEEQKPDIKGVVQVFTGGEDKMVPAAQVADFAQEMFENHVEYDIHVYKGAKHSFTNPDADMFAQKFNLPLAYNAKADADSWQKTLQLFAKVFGE